MKDKKVIVCVVVALLVFSFGSVSASSTEPKRYIPMVPDFITTGSKPKINIPYDVEHIEAKNFLGNFYGNPYLVVVDQWTGANNNTSENKKWELVFLKPVFKNKLSGLEFYYYDPLKNANTATRPMGVRFTDNSYWEVMRYPYNFTTKKFDSPIVQTFNGEYKFSYVVDSAPLSNRVSTYPYYSKVGDSKFTVYSYQVGPSAHYNWWLGNSGGGGTDEDNNDGTSSDSTSSGGTSSGGTSSGGTSSGSGSGQKPGIGGDGDIELGDYDTSVPVYITVKYFYYENGVKKAFNYDGKTFHTATLPKNAIHSYSSRRYNGYVTEYSNYRWLVDKDRTVEVIFIKDDGGSGGTSSGGTSSGGTSSGGGSSSGGDDGSSGGDGTYPKPGTGGDGDVTGNPGETNPPLFDLIIRFYYIDEKGYKKPFSYGVYGYFHEIKGVRHYTFYTKNQGEYYPEYSVYKWFLIEDREVEIIFYTKNSGGGGSSGGGSGGNSEDGSGVFPPIKPFDPDWWEKFEPANPDPWGGFDLFEGITEPKPLPPSDKLGDVPTVDDPLGGIDVPMVDKPFGDIDVPTVDNPLGGLDVPTVDNPLGGLDVPSVDNPLGGLDVPTVDNPFGGLDVPTVDNPLGGDIPTVDNPFGSIKVPVVDDPFDWRRE